jgi:DNA (cytosine-5)-methyltransferase 1
VASHDIAQPLRAGRQFSDMGDGQSNVVAHSLRANGFDASEDGTGRGTPLVPEVCPALKSRDYKGPSSDGDGDGDGAILVPMAFDTQQITSKANRTRVAPGLPASTLNQAGQMHIAHVETMPTLRAAASQDGPGHAARSGDSKDEYIVPVAYGIDEEQNAAEELMGTLKARTDGGGFEAAVAIRTAQTSSNGWGIGIDEQSFTLDGAQGQAVQTATQVRRLTPRECERLQGFPDDYTQVPYRNKPAADGPRYKALGNSMAVPVVRWIGERIERVSKL